MSNISQ